MGRVTKVKGKVPRKVDNNPGFVRLLLQQYRQRQEQSVAAPVSQDRLPEAHGESSAFAPALQEDEVHPGDVDAAVGDVVAAGSEDDMGADRPAPEVL